MARAEIGVAFDVNDKDARAVLRAFSELGPDAEQEYLSVNRDVSRMLRGRVRTAANAEGRQARIIPIWSSRAGLTPSVYAGGDSLIGRNRKPAWKLVYGSEFGARRLRQYKPWVGALGEGYWFFPTVVRSSQMIYRKWTDAIDDVLRAWGRGR